MPHKIHHVIYVLIEKHKSANNNDFAKLSVGLKPYANMVDQGCQKKKSPIIAIRYLLRLGKTQFLCIDQICTTYSKVDTYAGREKENLSQLVPRQDGTPEKD